MARPRRTRMPARAALALAAAVIATLAACQDPPSSSVRGSGSEHWYRQILGVGFPF